MANYYSHTVITDCYKLDEDLIAALEARGASCHPEGGEDETVLDGIVNERPPLKSYSIVWEEGWTEPCDDVDEFLVEYVGWDDEDVEKASPRFRELVLLSEPDMLHEILKLNPDADAVQMQEAWGCSKMRLDGFGGRSLTVTQKGYLYLCTGSVEINEDGTIVPGSKFTPWKDTDEAA